MPAFEVLCTVWFLTHIPITLLIDAQMGGYSLSPLVVSVPPAEVPGWKREACKVMMISSGITHYPVGLTAGASLWPTGVDHPKPKSSSSNNPRHPPQCYRWSSSRGWLCSWCAHLPPAFVCTHPHARPKPQAPKPQVDLTLPIHAGGLVRGDNGRSASESRTTVATVRTPQAARNWARPPCRHFKNQSCCCLGSAFEVAHSHSHAECRGMVWCELLLQLPFFFVAAWAYAKGKHSGA